MPPPPTTAPSRPAALRAPWPAAALLLLLACVAAPLTFDASIGDVVYLTVTWGAALLALAAARRRDDASFALLVATGLGLSALGDTVWILISHAHPVPAVSWADPAYLLGTLTLAVALFRAAGRGLSDPATRLDTATVVVLALLVIVTGPDGLGEAVPGLGPVGHVVLAAYPVLDAVLIGLVARVVWLRERTVVGRTFVVGAAAWLAADFGYLLAWAPGAQDRLTDIGWMAGGVLMAAGTWTHPAPARSSRLGGLSVSRAVVALLPLGVPIALFPFASRLDEQALLVAALATGLLLLLAVVRMVRLLRGEQQARREIETARDAALAASRTKSEFLATISHELRTPMHGVLGLGGLLQRSELDPRQQQWLAGLLEAAGSMTHLVDDLLDLSRIEAGRVDVVAEPMDVAEVARSAVAQEAAKAAHLDVALELDPALDRGPAFTGDPRRLRQVLVNLLSNASKFTPAGSVVLTVTVVDHEVDQQARLRFSVRDTGIGIAPQDVGRIFDPFVQADASSTREYGGSGLGLSICQRVVTAMGGTVQVASTPGRGSRFWFDLPLPRSGRAEAHTEPPAGQAAPAVLVVEDGEVNQLVAEGLLLGLGLAARTTDDAATALRMARELAPAAVLVDVALPGAALLAARLSDQVRVVAVGHGVRLPTAHATVARPLQPGELAEALGPQVVPAARSREEPATAGLSARRSSAR